MASKYEQLAYLKEKLLIHPLTLNEMTKLTGLSLRSLQRYLPVLKHEKGFTQINPGQRPAKYFIEEQKNFSLLNIQVIEQARDELAQGGNHRHAEVLQGVLNNLDNENPFQIHLPKDFELDHGPLSESNDYSKNINKFLQHIQNQDILNISYRNSHNETTQFLFHPLKLVLRVGRLYLLGKKEDVITSLRVDRIKRTNKKGQGFLPTPLPDFYKFTFGPWKPSQSEPETIKIECLSPWVHNLFLESNFNPKALIKGSIITLNLYLTPDFQNWLMGLFPHIRIIAPQHLQQSLKERLQQALSQMS